MNRQALKEAASWYALLCSEECSESEHGDWREWRQSSADNAWAWTQIEELQGSLQRLPVSLSTSVLLNPTGDSSPD